MPRVRLDSPKDLTFAAIILLPSFNEGQVEQQRSYAGNKTRCTCPMFSLLSNVSQTTGNDQ